MKQTMNVNPLMRVLSQGLKDMNVEVSPETQQKLISFLELLSQWNKVHNLTAVRDTKEMVTKHLLDSLSLMPFLNNGKNVCDVGTGAGLPGIPLSLCKPEMEFCLLDSSQKKINFVQQAILSLSLRNTQAVCSRVEHFHSEVPFDWVVSRAFGSLSEFIQVTGHLVSNQGRWLAMKGKLPQEELAAIPEGYTIEHIHSLSVANLIGERCLVVIKRV